MAFYQCTRETMKRQAVSFSSEQDDWKPIRELLDWIRQNTPQDSILLGNLDPAYYLYTGRKAVRGFSADPYLLFYSEKPETALGDVPGSRTKDCGVSDQIYYPDPESVFQGGTDIQRNSRPVDTPNYPKRCVWSRRVPILPTRYMRSIRGSCFNLQSGRNGSRRYGRIRSPALTILEDAPDRAHSVLPADLLPLRVRAARSS